MNARSLTLVMAVLGGCLVAAIPGQAAPPWLSVFSFGGSDTSAKQATKTPAKPLELTEREGPWLILATSFSGPQAELQAGQLVQELRDSYGMSAYVHRLHFDYTKPVNGLGVDKYGNPRKFKHLNGQEYDELAVMVGNYSGVEDPNAQKALDILKTARPKCLVNEKPPEAEGKKQWYSAQLNYLQRQMRQTKSRGPMGNAFVTRNPLLPEEMFTAKGLDPFVVDMNKDMEFSLLKNKSRYTVRIASFRGVDTMSPKKYEELTSKDRPIPKIEEAANKAHQLTAHLRSQGYEAYEFHDTTESIVCVGGFNDVGSPRQDGKMEINPAVLKMMQQFGPTEQKLPGQNAKQLQPRIILNMPLDYQPMPVEVPRSSIAAQYSPTAQRR